MNLIERFSNVKVLVIGDVMLDRYWWGNVDRISPEAPVPVVCLKESTDTPGGAANVAANIAGLGATAHLIGVVGNDADAELTSAAIVRAGIATPSLIPIEGRRTTVKTRVVAHGQQIVRVDHETDGELSHDAEDVVLARIADDLDRTDVIVLSDYAKGFLTRRVLAETIRVSNEKGKPVLVDPKGKDYTKYSGASLLTPNKREAGEAASLENNDKEIVAKAGKKLMSELSIGALLVTQGEDGMTLFAKDAEPLHLGSLAREVYDVTGAGDTVIATLGVAVGAGFDLAEAAFLSNLAAGIVVGQIGTSSITAAELENANSDR